MRILASGPGGDALLNALEAYANSSEAEVLGKAEKLEASGWEAYLAAKGAPASTTVM